jgi:AcrR family transcriptional regulator
MSARSAVMPPAEPRRRPGRPAGGVPVITREQLLDAAMRTIRTIGPQATIDDIAATAGVAKPTVYRVLGDRAAVVSGLSRRLVERAADAARPAADDVEPRAAFRSALTGFLKVTAEERNLFLFVNAGGHDPIVVARLVDESAADLVAMFTAFSSNPAAARAWAYAVIGALQSTVTMWLHDEWCDLDELADSLTALLWDGAGSAITLDRR